MDKLMLSREKINKIDEQMARLFAERMEAVSEIADFKAENNLPILDASREEQIIDKNSAFIGQKHENETHSSYVGGTRSVRSGNDLLRIPLPVPRARMGRRFLYRTQNLFGLSCS